MSKLLIVDDEQSICWGLQRVAQQLGHEAQVASSAEQGLAIAEQNPPDVIVLDVRLPNMDGLTAMERFQSRFGEVPIIIITAFGDLDTAMQAVRNGAFEYVVKPFDLADIRRVIERSLQVGHSSAESQPTGPPEPPQGILGKSAAMQAVFKHIALAAHAEVSVLLQGESGVGKELAAQAIHQNSSRRAAPFVAVNVAALSPQLAEAELFGHVAGAFTGAQQARKGLLVQADGGTLFLDEVAEIPLPVQVKLLRALEQQEVLPLGADEPVPTNFRIIAASHQNLQRNVKDGTFRHDLYYRLSAFEITLPPLRERREDVPLLARHFAAQYGQQNVRFADETLTELEQRDWRGNVRELRNAVEHALVLARAGMILPEHLPPPQSASPVASANGATVSLAEAVKSRAAELLSDPHSIGEAYERLLSEIEPELFAQALKQHGNECSPAARALGIHRTTLRRKLDQYGME